MTKRGKEKLIKVTLEFEDEIKTLEGKEAQEWRDEINSYIVTQSLRTGISGLRKRNWKVKEK